ncbi:MAG: class I SAM-dependent methyltransferase, partial [Kofleriaceae bacterium]
MTPLVCPGCRTRTGDRLDVCALERAGELLVCPCGRRYPIVDGVPIILRDPADFLRAEIATIVEQDLPPEVAAALIEPGPDDAPYARLLEHLSIYLDAHWGDRATPAPAPEGAARFGAAALVDRVAERANHPVRLAVELGCSVGRFVAELARGAEHVIGLDLQFGAVRRARRLLGGERLAYNRRVAGRHYLTAGVDPGDRAIPAGRWTPICGDALDPPLVPGVFERVVALNLLDSVSQPSQLLSVVDGL